MFSSVAMQTPISGIIQKYDCLATSDVATFVQYYGFHKSQGEENKSYDSNRMELPYFVPSQETAFEVSMLKHIDAELLLGKIS